MLSSKVSADWRNVGHLGRLTCGLAWVLRLPLCEKAKYRNSPKGLRAGKYQSALSDKDMNWPYAHSPDYLCQDVDTVLFGSYALSQMRGQLRLPLGLFMQASINRRLVTKMWIDHMLIVKMLTSSPLHIEQHSFTKVPSCFCLWFYLFSRRSGLTEERAEYLCQDVDTVLFGSYALSQLRGLRGQLRLPLCEKAKYRNSPKGLRAGKYQSALSDKDVNWPYAHSPDVDKFHPSHLATFFHKSPVMLLSLILFCICLAGTDRRKGWVPLPRCWHLFDSVALSQMRGQLRLPLCDPAKYRNSPKGLFMQASINRRLVTKMWVGHMLIVGILTSSTGHTEQHSFTKAVVIDHLWYFFFDSFALSQMRGQLCLPLCETAKYHNFRKGFFMQASINRRLVT